MNAYPAAAPAPSPLRMTLRSRAKKLAKSPSCTCSATKALYRTIKRKKRKTRSKPTVLNTSESGKMHEQKLKVVFPCKCLKIKNNFRIRCCFSSNYAAWNTSWCFFWLCSISKLMFKNLSILTFLLVLIVLFYYHLNVILLLVYFILPTENTLLIF